MEPAERKYLNQARNVMGADNVRRGASSAARRGRHLQHLCQRAFMALVLAHGI